MKANKSAAARMLPMPGVDVREQWDRNELDLRGTPLHPVVFKTAPLSTHLEDGAHPGKAICGVKAPPARNEPPGEKICAACRVAAGDKKYGAIGGWVNR